MCIHKYVMRGDRLELGCALSWLSSVPFSKGQVTGEAKIKENLKGSVSIKSSTLDYICM